MDKEQKGQTTGKTTCLFEDGNVHVHNEASFQKVKEHFERTSVQVSTPSTEKTEK